MVNYHQKRVRMGENGECRRTVLRMKKQTRQSCYQVGLCCTKLMNWICSMLVLQETLYIIHGVVNLVKNACCTRWCTRKPANMERFIHVVKNACCTRRCTRKPTNMIDLFMLWKNNVKNAHCQEGAPGNPQIWEIYSHCEKIMWKMPVVHAGVPGSPREFFKKMLKMSLCKYSRFNFAGAWDFRI